MKQLNGSQEIERYKKVTMHKNEQKYSKTPALGRETGLKTTL